MKQYVIRWSINGDELGGGYYTYNTIEEAQKELVEIMKDDTYEDGDFEIHEYDIRMENKYGIEIIMIDNEFYAIDGWNGDTFNDCWKTDKSGNEILDGNQYRIRPIYTMVDEDEYEIDSYELLY